MVSYWIFGHLSEFMFGSFLDNILHCHKNGLLTTKLYKTLLHIRSWFFLALSLPILTDILSLGFTLMKEVLAILAHYITDNNTFPE